MGISGNQRELSYYTIKPALISDLHACGWSMGTSKPECGSKVLETKPLKGSLVRAVGMLT